MYNLILTLIIILSVLIVITVMIQLSKQNNVASALTSGADKLFGRQKARGSGAITQHSTTVFGVIRMILLFILASLSSK